MAHAPAPPPVRAKRPRPTAEAAARAAGASVGRAQTTYKRPPKRRRRGVVTENIPASAPSLASSPGAAHTPHHKPRRKPAPHVPPQRTRHLWEPALQACTTMQQVDDVVRAHPAVLAQLQAHVTMDLLRHVVFRPPTSRTPLQARQKRLVYKLHYCMSAACTAREMVMVWAFVQHLVRTGMLHRPAPQDMHEAVAIALSSGNLVMRHAPARRNWTSRTKHMPDIESKKLVSTMEMIQCGAMDAALDVLPNRTFVPLVRRLVLDQPARPGPPAPVPAPAPAPAPADSKHP